MTNRKIPKERIERWLKVAECCQNLTGVMESAAIGLGPDSLDLNELGYTAFMTRLSALVDASSELGGSEREVMVKAQLALLMCVFTLIPEGGCKEDLLEVTGMTVALAVANVERLLYLGPDDPTPFFSKKH